MEDIEQRDQFARGQPNLSLRIYRGKAQNRLLLRECVLNVIWKDRKVFHIIYFTAAAQRESGF